MKEFTGDTYQSTPYAKMMAASESKVGKTSFLVASALGVFPGQKNGAIVDDPRHLHVITTDSNALGGLKRFLLETCKAPKEALGFKVYNMQQDLLDAAGTEAYDRTFMNTMFQTLETIGSRVRGTSMVLASSLTGLAEGLLNGLRDPAGQNKGGGMDIARWTDFQIQITEMRNRFQAGDWHTIWEAHILKTITKNQSGGDESSESIQVSGKSGVNFPYNVEQFFRIRRMFGQRVGDTKCDYTYLDPKPTYTFITNGRGFNEALKSEEADMTMTFHKLGLNIGRWGAKTATPKPAVKPAVK